MASLAPALCNPCAIDQAMLRLFATPKTTAIRPSRLEDIWLLLNLKGKDNSGKGLFTTETQSRKENVQVCHFVPLSLCDSVVKFYSTGVASSTGTAPRTGQLALTNAMAYTNPMMENPATRLTCATSPTTIAKTICSAVPTK